MINNIIRNLSKTLFLFGIIVFMAFSCEKENKDPCACGIENPQENIEWLKYILDRRFCTEVYLYTYKEQEFIGIHDCPDMADGGWVIYDCDGTIYCQFVGLNAYCDCTPDFLENAQKTLIYKQNN